MRPLAWSGLFSLVVIFTSFAAAAADSRDEQSARGGVSPRDGQGRSLNFDFEDGTLRDWSPQGAAFKSQPITGDTVNRRRGDMASRHQGRFWVGTFEIAGDAAQGTLTSVAFRVSKPFASFLIAGGSRPSACVELVRVDSGQVVFRATGDDNEDMEAVMADLSAHLGKEILIRLVDADSDAWGHINFDDFRLHDTKPDLPARRRPGSPDTYSHAGLEPEEAARAMTVPPGFNVTLFAGEPDVVQPIAMTIDDRGRLWVAEAYSYPRRVPQAQARDRILILEDSNGDGRFDSRKVFADQLNLVSGLEVGFGGVWVGAAPEFYFIPDKNGDDIPDGPRQVLLDGWGQQDTHETLNSFVWGPDGWLYGCHGVFTHSRVGKPGTSSDERVRLNAATWRYHPVRHAFEVFAHGTSNPWGIDFDARGQMFITACVIPHLYHISQGGRYERQAGQHFNPYTYDDIKTIADHRHYLGANPHGGNGRSDSAGGGHAHSGAMIYLGGAWPAEYAGSLFMNNIHGARLNRDILVQSGSGFVGSHAPDFLLANDLWSQIISLKTGPDGSLFMIDWYDKNQCHHKEVSGHDRTNGRIFKVSYGQPKRAVVDLARESSPALVAMQGSSNEWYARHARRILQERGEEPGTARALEQMGQKFAGNTAVALRVLLAQHAVGALLSDDAIGRPLSHADPVIRAWAIQLATEQGAPRAAILARFVELARSDASPMVRLYLASAMGRVPLAQRWETVAALVGHGEDASDVNLPLMYWYAAEPLAVADSRRAAELAAGSPLSQFQEFMARRIAAIGTPESLSLLVGELGRVAQSARRLALLAGIEEALRGRRQVAMPAAWPGVFKILEKDSDSGVRSRAVALGVNFGDEAARESLRRVVTDSRAAAGPRQQAIAALLKVKDPVLVDVLHKLVQHAELGGPAIRGLAAYDDPATPAILIKAYPALDASERRDVLSTLASRKDSARGLIAAVESGKVPRGDLTADIVRQIRNLNDTELAGALGRVWGTVRETSSDRARAISQAKTMLSARGGKPPDRSIGRAVYSRICQQCHTLFGLGGQVGPDLTGSNRADLDYVLSNVLDPSALIGKDYQASVIATTDGRILTGIIRAEDKDSITLVTANETITIPASEVEQRRTSEQSMMPEDLWKPLSQFEIRSLVSYLASPAQVSLPAAESARDAP